MEYEIERVKERVDICSFTAWSLISAAEVLSTTVFANEINVMDGKCLNLQCEALTFDFK